jgi:transcriptional regulator with XRE-family HTH domain
MRIMPLIYDYIREAIAASDKSRYRIAKETGIGEPQLCQFMAGTKGLSVEALEKLADCLGMEIVTRPSNNDGGKTSRSTKAHKKGS